MSDMIEEMSKDELFSLWGETQDGDIPSNRSKNSPLNSFYPLTDYFVTVEDNKPIAAIGYSKKGEFTLFGGVFSTRRGEFSKLYDHFMSNTTGPYIAGISSSVLPNEDWAKSFERRGWLVAPTDEELGEYADNPTVKEFKEYYGNHPKGAKWGVKDLPLIKSGTWKEILKVKATKTHNSKGEEKDRCARIADEKYKGGIKGSAYKSGAIVRCREGEIWRDEK